MHAVTTVDLELAGVVFPCDTELNHALRNGANFEGCAVLGVLLEEGAVLEGAGELCSIGRVKLALGRKLRGGLMQVLLRVPVQLIRIHWLLTVVRLLELRLGGNVRHVERRVM